MRPKMCNPYLLTMDNIPCLSVKSRPIENNIGSKATEILQTLTRFDR